MGIFILNVLFTKSFFNFGFCILSCDFCQDLISYFVLLIKFDLLYSQNDFQFIRLINKNYVYLS